MLKIYHKEVGFPLVVSQFFGRKYRLSFSSHAKAECRKDRYGLIIPPREITVTKDNLIEVEITNNVLVGKILIRTKFNDTHDISIAFIPDYDTGFVKTLWLNETTDIHRTLDKSKYNRP